MECTSARKDVFRADLPDMTADAAWEAMKTADKFRDIDDFKEVCLQEAPCSTYANVWCAKAFLCYAKVLFNQGVPVDIADVEKGFREENRNIYLIAKVCKHSWLMYLGFC